MRIRSQLMKVITLVVLISDTNCPFGTSVSPVLIVRTVPYSDPWHVLSAWSFLFGRLYKLSCNRPQALLESGPSSYAPEISTHWSISSCAFSLGLEQKNKHTIPTFNEVKENQVLQEPLKQTLTMWLCPNMRDTNIYQPKLPGKDTVTYWWFQTHLKEKKHESVGIIITLFDTAPEPLELDDILNYLLFSVPLKIPHCLCGWTSNTVLVTGNIFNLKPPTKASSSGCTEIPPKRGPRLLCTWGRPAKAMDSYRSIEVDQERHVATWWVL